MAQHKVQEFDSISRMARRFDYNIWKTLWDENPELQQKRNNPNVLFHGVKNPDDRSTFLHEPDSINWTPEDERQEPVQTSTHASFGAVTDDLWLRFRVVDIGFEPIAGATYEMDIAGRTIASDQLTPDGQGVISVKIEPQDLIAKLTVTCPAPADTTTSGPPVSPLSSGPPSSSSPAPVTPPPQPVSFEIWMQVGRLDPIKDKAPAPDDKFTPGVQQRLNNLGFGAGSVTGISNPTTESAIRRFQKLVGITEESVGKPIAGPQTQDWLEKLHDKPGKPPPPAPESTQGSSEGTGVGGSGSSGPSQPVVDPLALEAAKQRYELAQQKLDAATRERKAVFETFRKNKTGEGIVPFQAAQQREAAAKEEVDRAKRDLDRVQRGG